MRKKALFFLVLLSIINLLIFLNRDRFQYRSFADYNSLYSTCDPACYSKWKDFVLDFPEHELADAKKITDTIVGGATTSLEKIKRLGDFLYQRFHRQLGNPTDDLLATSPFNQYRKLEADSSMELWCNNFAHMFSWFCWSQGIVTRNVEIINPGDHHVLSECYLPETGKWMAVDLTNNLLTITGNGQLLNVLDIRKATRDGQSIIVSRSGNKEISTDTLLSNAAFLQAYYKPDLPVHYYHWINYFKVTGKKYKLKSYILPVSWYDIFLEKGGNNLFFYLKLLLLVLWVIALTAFLVSLKKFRT